MERAKKRHEAPADTRRPGTPGPKPGRSKAHRRESWSAEKQQALTLHVGEGMSIAAVARALNRDRDTVAEWTRTQTWQMHRDAFLQETTRRLHEEGVASKIDRLMRRQRDWERLREVVEMRAERARNLLLQAGDAAHGAGDAPDVFEEETTGWVVRVPTREGVRLEVDVALAKSLLDLEREVAREMGDYPRSGRGTSSATTPNPVVIEGGEALAGYTLAPALDVIDALESLVALGRLPESEEELGSLAWTIAHADFGMLEGAGTIGELLDSGHVVAQTDDPEPVGRG